MSPTKSPMSIPMRRGAFVSFLLTALGLAPGAAAAALDHGTASPESLGPVPAGGVAEDTAQGLSCGAPVGDSSSVQGERGAARHVGPYLLLEALGAGGMGEVFAAEAAHPVRRRVALKLLRSGLPDAAQRGQFELECQALALVEHEHIARYYDSGVDEEGRPWLAMELVAGEPITHYCERRALDLDARLALLADVARAVAHMHARGVIHGDLKPKNILVSEREGRAVVKVIDLGAARIAGRPAPAPATLTGTLLYMAPEQLASEDPPLRERCDVYALGLVLRELLLGRERVGPSGADGVALAFQRATRALPSPSAILAEARAPWSQSGQPSQPPGRAEPRGLSAPRLQRRLQAGLEALVMRATAFDPLARTPTARALAGDLERDVARARQAAAGRARGRALAAAALAASAVTWLVA
ncbi:MAG: serine/threonine-protein kinase [Planctomycetota bacterium]